MERMTKGEGMTPEEYIAMVEEEKKNLTKCNLNLQEWLDNKEKVNKSLREENEKLKKYYDRDKEELMESCYSLAKENDKLKSDLMEDMKEITKLEKENKKLKEELKELEETLEHRDSVLSIMYDLLRSDLSDYEQLCMIDVVIDVEVGNEPQNKLREELLDRFWKRDF